MTDEFAATASDGDPGDPPLDPPLDPPSGSAPGSGPFGDEARTLLHAVQDWAQRALPEPPSGHGGPECRWCPVCQFASILRGEHPEVIERMAEVGTALAGAFRAVVDAAVTPAPPAPSSSVPTDAPDPGAGDGPSADTAAGAPPWTPTRPIKPQPGPRIQRIHLDDES